MNCRKALQICLVHLSNPKHAEIKKLIYGNFRIPPLITSQYIFYRSKFRTGSIERCIQPILFELPSVSTAAEVSVVVIIPTGHQCLWVSGMTPEQSSKETSCPGINEMFSRGRQHPSPVVQFCQRTVMTCDNFKPWKNATYFYTICLYQIDINVFVVKLFLVWNWSCFPCHVPQQEVVHWEVLDDFLWKSIPC